MDHILWGTSYMNLMLLLASIPKFEKDNDDRVANNAGEDASDRELKNFLGL